MAQVNPDTVDTPVPNSTALPQGMIVRGNLNLQGRPVIQNADGTHSSEYSTSFGTDQGEVLVPTIVNGKFLSADGKKPVEGSPAEAKMFRAAAARYRATGEHLGIFDTPENSDAYSESVHNRDLSNASKPVYVVPSVSTKKPADERKDFNPTMALMRLFKVPLTRDNYLNIEHMGAPPKEVHPEEEADMPHRFRHPIIHSNTMPEPYMTEAQKEAEKAQAQDIVIGGDKKPGAKVLPNKKGIAPSLDTDNPPVAQGYVDMNTNRAPLGKGKGVMDTRIPMVKDWDPQPREQ